MRVKAYWQIIDPGAQIFIHEVINSVCDVNWWEEGEGSCQATQLANQEGGKKE